jgi:hypothetical protein
MFVDEKKAENVSEVGENKALLLFQISQLGLLLIIDNTELGLGGESVISFQHMQQKLPQSL